MPDKDEPKVTFTDRRKISAEGEIRPEAAAQEEADRREAEQREAASKAPQSNVTQFPGNAASYAAGFRSTKAGAS